jgi:hypothetical protein
MIIKDLAVKNEYSYSILTCSLSRKTGTEPVFIAVPDKYKDYLDPHCADPFVLAFLLLACKNDEDIIIEDGFVSEELAFNIESILFPLLVKMGCGKGKTKIIHNAQFVPLSDSLGGGICQRQMTGGWKLCIIHCALYIILRP